MNQAVVFTADILKIIKGLPERERLAVTNALVSNYFLGNDIADSLNGTEAIAYAMINNSISRASEKYASAC